VNPTGVELRIECDCGTRFKFDVLPLNGRMPQRIECPGCGVDRTAAANEQLRARLTPEPGAVATRSFALGLTGAAVAGLVGMLAWFFLIQSTGHQIAFAAWGVGLLVGLGARAMCREGGRKLGYAAGACAFVAVVGGQLLAVRSPAGGLGWLTLLWLLMAVASAFKLATSRAER